MNKLFGFALSLVLVFGAACSEEETYNEDFTTDGTELDGSLTEPGIEEGGFTGWDTNANMQLEETEFSQRFGESSPFRTWDADASGNLDESEFAEGTFGLWDENRDSFVDENEFNSWSNRWFGNEFNETYEDWNAAGEEGLTSDAFTERFRESGMYGEWDLDSTGDLNEQEFSQGVYGLFDRDESGSVDQTEWNEWSSAWGLENGMGQGTGMMNNNQNTYTPGTDMPADGNDGSVMDGQTEPVPDTETDPESNL